MSLPADRSSSFNIVKTNKNCKILFRPILTSGSDRHSKKSRLWPMPYSAWQFRYTEQNKKESNLLLPLVTYVQTKGQEMAPYVIARLAFSGQSVGQIMDRVAQCECEIKC